MKTRIIAALTALLSSTASLAEDHGDRRMHRVGNPTEAASRFLGNLKDRNELEAVALTTESGELIAGAGPLDLEWMGTVGASRQRAHLQWDGHALNVRRFTVNHVLLHLTTAGPPIDGLAAASGLQRILRAGGGS